MCVECEAAFLFFFFTEPSKRSCNSYHYPANHDPVGGTFAQSLGSVGVSLEERAGTSKSDLFTDSGTVENHP